jgi:predicted SAM-dependent methyltransferase
MTVKLDIGCGKNKVPGYIGIDMNPDVNPDILCNCCVLPVRDTCADVIAANHLGEHLLPDEMHRFFCELNRVLKDGGTITLKIDREWTMKRLRKKDPTHVWRYRKSLIRDLAIRVGFTVSSIKIRRYWMEGALRNKMIVALTK